jgi:hypothetical protein
MGALDEFGECIAAAAGRAGIKYCIILADGSYLYRVRLVNSYGVPSDEDMNPGQFAKVLGIEWEWNGLSGGYDRAA